MRFKYLSVAAIVVAAAAAYVHDRAQPYRFRYENVLGTSMDMTISFTRFGVPVDTTPPPDDQVLDAGSLLALAGRAG